MQHGVQQTIENYWTNFILEIEHAIELMDPKFQETNRPMATKILKQIHNANYNSNVTHKRHSHITKTSVTILTNNAMIAQADNGNTSHYIQTRLSQQSTYLPSR